jgi:hypothetical protein
MRRFIPPRPPLWIRFTKNPWALIPSVLLVVFGTSFYLYQTKQDLIRKQILNSDVLSHLPSFMADSKMTEAEEDDGEREYLTEEPSSIPVAADLVGEETSVVALDTPEDSPPPSPLSFPTPGPLKVHLKNYEVSKGFLSQILSQSQILNDSPDYMVVTLNKGIQQFDQGVSGGQALLVESHEANIQAEGPQLLILPTSANRTGGEFLGISTLVSIGQLGEKSVSLHLEFQRRLREFIDQPTQLMIIQESFQMTPGQSVIFIGLLPHRKLSEPELRQAQGSALDIMRSASFLNRDSEFVLLVEPQVAESSTNKISPSESD